MGARWRRIAAVAAAATAVALGSAAPASAAGEPDTGGYGAFVLEASHGYRIFVLAFSGPAFRNGEVLISVARKGAAVSYLAPATVTETRIDADLGRLGKIEVEFQPSGKEVAVRPPCDSDSRITYEKGNYVGEIEFHGEEGYTRASVSSVPFSIGPLAAFGCFGPTTGEASGHGLPGARLAVRSRRGSTRISMKAVQNRPGARLHVEASIEERRGEIIIAREVDDSFGTGAFDFDPHLRFATLRPGQPFSGTARFQRHAERSRRLTGGLAVDFPGRSNVRLTGARFRSTLVHARLMGGKRAG